MFFRPLFSLLIILGRMTGLSMLTHPIMTHLVIIAFLAFGCLFLIGSSLFMLSGSFFVLIVFHTLRF